MAVDIREPVKFVEEPNTHLKCPICRKCYEDPVINGNVNCGHTFCRGCTQNLDKCPIDSAPCDSDKLVLNRLVVGQINDLLIHCPYGLIQQNNEWIEDKSGCSEHLTLGTIDEHRKICQYVLVSCKNNKDCGKYRRQDLKNHLQNCRFNPCPNFMYGCDFRGLLSSIQQHVENCSLKSPSIYLERENKTLNKEVKCLKEKVIFLESGREELSSQLATLEQTVNIYFSSINGLQQKVEVLQCSNKSLSSIPTSPSSSPTNTTKFEQWEKPFQFKCIGTLRGHQEVVWCLTIYHGKLYSAGTDTVIKVWDLDALAKGCIDNLKGHKKRIHCSCVDGGYLYTAGDDLSIIQWNLASDSHKNSIIENAHDNTICSMLILSDHLFTSSFSLIKAKVWNIKTLTLKHSISGLNHWVRALALSPKKEWLYNGSNNAINIWDTATFESVSNIKHNLGSVYSLAVTRQYIIAGTFDQNIQLFDVKSGEKVFNLKGHFGAITGIVPSPSGKFLFSSSHDCIVQMWNLETFLPIQTLSRHQGSVNTLALYGNMLLTGSDDKEIKVGLIYLTHIS
ncbi:hypothetical protein LOTGIDRAFT_108875 [Lottia gigantea]|uniref:RING-type E3 ubiquitin transferase n=1 Tax=Lottia gigantea TaxID=225164 RepID=V3YXU2_LOTGI|nr:hypothetical protein LOTGIDRAFT_108875 [Lottia gigantea]ESO82888.1 hypothetical protein LOTGIDRAFT_108875 [Lottia gigantea]